MLKNSRKNRYESTLEKMIQQIQKKGFSQVKADFGDMERPARLVSQSKEDVYIPDATAMNKLGCKGYFEIGQKNKETEKLVNKWKILETLANIKQGVFQIFVPHGSMKFTQELITKYNINAELVKI